MPGPSRRPPGPAPRQGGSAHRALDGGFWSAPQGHGNLPQPAVVPMAVWNRGGGTGMRNGRIGRRGWISLAGVSLAAACAPTQAQREAREGGAGGGDLLVVGTGSG